MHSDISTLLFYLRQLWTMGFEMLAEIGRRFEALPAAFLGAGKWPVI